jgi:protein-tyrosine phosphatase
VIPKIKQWLSGSAPVPDDSAVSTRILMVCTGNICRSPTAEGVLRTKLERAGLATQVRVDSAGTQGYHTAEPPDPRAIRAAAQRGYDIARLRARPVQPDDFARFDWLLAMDQTHVDWMTRRAPAAAQGRIGLLMPLAPPGLAVTEVPDPYYGGPAGFDHVLDLLEAACEGVVERLRAGQPLTRAQPGKA